MSYTSKVFCQFCMLNIYLTFTCAALGISDEVDKFALKGNKKKKGRKLDEDYMVSMISIFLCVRSY